MTRRATDQDAPKMQVCITDEMCGAVTYFGN